MFVGLALYLALLGLAWWGMLKFLPDNLSLRAFGHALTIGQVHQHILGNAALLFVILPAALWVEWALVGWRESSVRHLLLTRTPSAKTDLACFVAGQA